VNSSVDEVLPGLAVATEPLADRLLDTVSRTARRIRIEMRRHDEAGLTVPQFRALRFVARNPGTDLTGLASFLGMSLSSASPFVGRLERSGLLERTVDPGERRRLRLHLTAAGQDVVDRAVEATRAWLAAELRDLTAADRRRLDDGLALLHRIGLTGDER
jgi:DNA-binding MarR family transcriptional regulator